MKISTTLLLIYTYKLICTSIIYKIPLFSFLLTSLPSFNLSVTYPCAHCTPLLPQLLNPLRSMNTSPKLKSASEDGPLLSPEQKYYPDYLSTKIGGIPIGWERESGDILFLEHCFPWCSPSWSYRGMPEILCNRKLCPC